jgi:predicted dehydrogenase
MKARWGILSTAQHGVNTVIPAIQAAPSASVDAIASRDGARARQIAQKLNIPTSYDSYEALLADPNIDAIYIPLPNHLHKEWAIRCAQAGKHVLCEKPIALNTAEAEEMLQAFRDTGLKFAETFQWRHHPQATRFLDLLRQNVIGEMRMIDAGFSFMLNRPNDIRWKPEMGGGSLYDVGCYPISFARYITGQEPVAVTGQIHWHANGVDDLAVATMEFPSGVLAQVNCSFILPLRRYYEVVGSEGSLVVPRRAYNPIGDKTDEIQRFSSDAQLVETYDLGRLNCYVLMAEDFSQAVLGNRDLLFPMEDIIGNMRVIDAIFASAHTGQRVAL